MSTRESDPYTTRQIVCCAGGALVGAILGGVPGAILGGLIGSGVLVLIGLAEYLPIYRRNRRKDRERIAEIRAARQAPVSDDDGGDPDLALWRRHQAHQAVMKLTSESPDSPR